MNDNKENKLLRNLGLTFGMISQFKEINYEDELTPIQARLYFLMLKGSLIRGENESLYGWCGRIGLSNSTIFGIFKKNNKNMHLSVANKISEATGADVEWIRHGTGVPFPIYNYDEIIEQQIDEALNTDYYPDNCDELKGPPITIEKEGLTVTTALVQDKLQQAFETTETALENQHRIMQPHAKAEFIVMLYTALVNQQTQDFNQHLLQTIIYEVENQLEIQRRIMSSEKKTLLIMAIYTLYSGDASNNEAIQQTAIQLIRSAA